jgi:Uma2 family endonuclease
MVKVNEVVARMKTLADLEAHLGGIPLDRLLFRPLPGTATEADLQAMRKGPAKWLYELIDGVLVEKPLGPDEITLTGEICLMLDEFREDHLILGYRWLWPQLCLWPGRVRIPDTCFVMEDHLPNKKVLDETIPNLVPDLAVEVLNRSNRKKEMRLKRRDYFQAGVQMVWEIQPKTQTAEVYTSPTKRRRIGKDGVIDGGDILPGFNLSLKELFARLKKKK